MFKSIFAKYISAFMLIIILCFALLVAITAVTVSSYTISAKKELVERASSTAITFIEGQLAKYESASGEESDPLLFLTEDESGSVDIVLSSISAYSEDLTVIITDTHGQILLKITANTVSRPENAEIPSDIFHDFRSGNHSIDQLKTIEGLFENSQIVNAMPIKHTELGNDIGYLFICADGQTVTELGEVMIKTILISSLWVVVAALIAVYVITDKIIEPLKYMRRAARSFAAGDFSVRVPVRGKDEVAELATAFNNMATSLEAAEKMRNSFMASVSHDLRTPMTTIAGFIDGILDGAIPPEKHEYYLNIIAVEVRRLSRLVSQLLDISRIEAGDRKFNFERFDVCEMARQILISFEQKIDKKRLDVEFECDSDNMFAYADRDAIYQITYNLCDNAVKFSSEGGKLSISIKVADKHKINVCVYNEGQGIPPEDLPYVFERFYKGDKSRGLDKTGVGLGLYISKTIIDAHKENIFVESESGKYCRFVFTLTNAKDNNI